MRRVRGSLFETYLSMFHFLKDFHSYAEIMKALNMSNGYVSASIFNMEKQGVFFERSKDIGKHKKYKIISTEREFYTALKIPMYSKPRKEKQKEKIPVNYERGLRHRSEYWFILTR